MKDAYKIMINFNVVTKPLECGRATLKSSYEFGPLGLFFNTQPLLT